MRKNLFLRDFRQNQCHLRENKEKSKIILIIIKYIENATNLYENCNILYIKKSLYNKIIVLY